MSNPNAGPYAIGSKEWNGLSKMIEEMGEALQVFGKIIGCGGSDVYGWTDLDLRAKIVEELGDVQATIAFFMIENLTFEERAAIGHRAVAKRAAFHEWSNGGE